MASGNRLYIALGILVTAAMLAGIGAGIRRSVHPSCVTVVRVSEFDDGSYVEPEETVEGIVTSGTTQRVYLTDSMTVKEVRVKEGQSVKKGDILLVCDTRKAQLAYESCRLERMKIENKIRSAGQDQKLRKELELDLKEELLKEKKSKEAIGPGTIRASADGIVREVGDPKHPPQSGEAFIRIGSSGGCTVRAGISERLIGSIRKGDRIRLISWQNGSEAAADIDHISYCPDTSGEFAADDGLSMYQFTAKISGEDVQFEENESVGIELLSDKPEHDSGLRVMKAFVRRDNGRKYVLKRGENGKLERVFIGIGRSYSDAYEVISGLKKDDWIAFPYGKHIAEGMKTQKGTLDDLYKE